MLTPLLRGVSRVTEVFVYGWRFASVLSLSLSLFFTIIESYFNLMTFFLDVKRSAENKQENLNFDPRLADNCLSWFGNRGFAVFW